MKRKILSAVVAAVALGLFGSGLRADNISLNAEFEEAGHTNSYESAGINYSLPASGSSPAVNLDGSFGAGAYNFTLASTANPLTLNSGTTTTGIAQNFLGNTSPTSPSAVTVSSMTTALNYSPSGAPISNPATNTFQAVCIDFTHEISPGDAANWSVVNLTQVQANPSGTSGDGNGVGITATQALAINDLWNSLTGISNLSNEDTAATLQLAVWDILYDQTVGANKNASNTALFTGNSNIGASGNNSITVGNAMSDAVDAMNAASATIASGNPYTIDVYAMVDLPPAGFVQDFALIGPVETNVTTGTPLPRSAFAGFSLLAGFAGFGMLRKRRDNSFQIA